MSGSLNMVRVVLKRGVRRRSWGRAFFVAPKYSSPLSFFYARLSQFRSLLELKALVEIPRLEGHSCSPSQESRFLSSSHLLSNENIFVLPRFKN